MFAVPGAFTPTCHLKHLPGFIESADHFKKEGIDTVACVAVNDPFVMAAWADASGGKGKVLFLSDGNAEFTKKIGMDFDGSGSGSARAPSATPCSSMTAWSRCWTSRIRPACATQRLPRISSSSSSRLVLVSQLFLRRSGMNGAMPCAGELVGPLVVVMAVMALDPVPAHVMPARGLVELLPKLDILHRLACLRCASRSSSSP